MKPGKKFLVTGAGRGIGAATARLLAERGCKVWLVARTQMQLEETAATIRAAGGIAETDVCDVSEAAEISKVFARAKKEWGGFDGMVHAAAIAPVALIQDMSLEVFEKTIRTNLTGSWFLAKEFFAQARGTKADPAAIVFVASISGIQNVEKFPGLAAYSASKFGVCGLTEVLAVEGRALQIRVNAVAPGAVDTQMLREAAPHLKTETTPEDIARTLAFLVDNEQAPKLSGSIVEVWSNA